MDGRQLAGSMIAVGSMLVAGGCSTSGEPTQADAGSAVNDAGPTPIIFDYSPTLSDVTALMYLTQHPDVELLAVTLAGTGESHCAAGVANTIELLALAGRPEVPVACGRTDPIGPGNDWPTEWRERSDALAGLELSTIPPDLSIDAADLIADVAAQQGRPVTVIAVGPLTNLAAVIEEHDDLAEHVAAIYTMGGAFDVSGNAPNRSAEWNYFIDPTAVQVVFDSDIPVTIIPLDATNLVPVTYDWFVQLTVHHTTPAAAVVHDLLAVTPGWELGFDFWDELAAAVALDPTLVTFEDRRVGVVLEGERAGRTRTDSEGATVRVAFAPDTERFTSDLLVGLNGGLQPPADVAATPAELGYFEAIGESTDVLDAGIGALFETPEAMAVDQVVDEEPSALTERQQQLLRDFFRVFWSGAVELIEVHAATLSGLDVPKSLGPQHDAYLAAIDVLVADESRRLELLDDLQGEQLMGFLWEADANLERVDATCSELELQAVVRGLDIRVCP